jgi:hypothetical protein
LDGGRRYLPIKIPFFTFFFCGVKHSRRPIIRVPDTMVPETWLKQEEVRKQQLEGELRSVISPERFVRELLNQDAGNGFHN